MSPADDIDRRMHFPEPKAESREPLSHPGMHVEHMTVIPPKERGYVTSWSDRFSSCGSGGRQRRGAVRVQRRRVRRPARRRRQRLVCAVPAGHGPTDDGWCHAAGKRALRRRRGCVPAGYAAGNDRASMIRRDTRRQPSQRPRSTTPNNSPPRSSASADSRVVSRSPGTAGSQQENVLAEARARDRRICGRRCGHRGAGRWEEGRDHRRGDRRRWRDASRPNQEPVRVGA